MAKGLVDLARRIEVIAVDFDGTLVENKYPKVGKLIDKAKAVVNRFALSGGKVIIWTCREGSSKLEAIEFLRRNGVMFHAVNDNIPERVRKFGNNCRKVGADMYIDDRANGGLDWDKVEEVLFGR